MPGLAVAVVCSVPHMCEVLSRHVNNASIKSCI